METRELRDDELDLELVCRHREAMFREAGQDDAVLRTMTAHFRDWLRPRLRDRSYFGFVMSDGDEPIAGIGLMTIDWPPHPAHPALDMRGYVLNVYVEPSHRKRGVARQMMALAEAEFARRGVSFAILHATGQGRALYAGMGWSGTTEMAKRIDRDSLRPTQSDQGVNE
jgi:GNAT superfamily N-acetyltransferase